MKPCELLLDLDDLSRSCTSKKRYESEWQAKFAADESMARQRSLRLSWYQCKYCSGWHLTEQ